MAQGKRLKKHQARFEERLAEEAIKFKEAAEKSTARQHCQRTAVAASAAGREGRPHERLATVPRVASAEVKSVRGQNEWLLRLFHW